jgi:hypothetical protein
MGTILAVLLSLGRAALVPRANLVPESAALRQQLDTYLRRKKRPKVRPADRALWVALSRLWPGWQDSLAFVTPATVIAWHRQGFRRFWRWRSRRRGVGRPRISHEHIELIKRLTRENVTCRQNRIADELRLELGIRHSTSTIRRHMIRGPDPCRGQSWRQLITNHSREVFACDSSCNTRCCSTSCTSSS